MSFHLWYKIPICNHFTQFLGKKQLKLDKKYYSTKGWSSYLVSQSCQSSNPIDTNIFYYYLLKASLITVVGFDHFLIIKQFWQRSSKVLFLFFVNSYSCLEPTNAKYNFIKKHNLINTLKTCKTKNVIHPYSVPKNI